MGRAQILSGGDAGRYTVRLDYGAAQKAATIEALNAAIAQLDTKIAAQQVMVNNLTDAETQARARYQAALSSFVAAAQSRDLAEAKTRVLAEKTAAQTAHEEAQDLLAVANAAVQAADSALDAAGTALMNASEAVALARPAYEELEAALVAAKQALDEAEEASRLEGIAVTQKEAAYQQAVDAGQPSEALRLQMEAAQIHFGETLQSLRHMAELIEDQEAEAIEAAHDLAVKQEALAVAEAAVPPAQELLQLRTQEQILAASNEAVAKAAADGSGRPSDAAQNLSSLDGVRANAQQWLNQYKAEFLQAQSEIAPARIALDKLKGLRANHVRDVAQWTAFEPYETKQVWCTDLTEDGVGSSIATIDIDGESTLTLLAPGCRAWSAGDGTMSAADKAAQLEVLNAAYDRAEVARAENQAARNAAMTDEAVLTAKLKDLQALHRESPTPESAAVLTVVGQQLSNKRQDIINHDLRDANYASKMAQLYERKTALEARPASASPNVGDGIMVAPQVMSPEQAFWNTGVMPGWQKWKPTYRWGTITALDYDADTASVSLASATSSAQGLSINQTSTLTNVPVAYMSCNAKAFEVGDRCVVKFNGQDWASPTVIGFLDNPKPCESFQAFYSISGRQSGNGLISQQTKYKGQNWDAVEAPAPIQPRAWLGWTDGVLTRARSDGKATANRVVLGSYLDAGNIHVAMVTVSVSWSSQWLVEQPGGGFKKFGIAHLVWTTQWSGSLGGAWYAPDGYSVPTFSGEVDNTVELSFDERPSLYVSAPPILVVCPTLTFSLTRPRGTFTYFATPSSASHASEALEAIYVPQTVSPLSV